MSVQIRRIHTTLKLSKELNEDIHNFHRHLFDDLLRLGRGGVEFAPEHSPFPLLIVPLQRKSDDINYDLDYECIKEVIQGVPKIPSNEVRKNFKFHVNNFLNTVVIPWYRAAEQTSYYYVGDVNFKTFI